MVHRLAARMPVPSLALAIESLNSRWELLSPETKRELGLRFVQQVLNPIHHAPADFLSNVECLRRVRRLIAELAESQAPPVVGAPNWSPIARLDAWCEVPRAIHDARQTMVLKKAGRKSSPGSPSRELQSQFGRRMAVILGQALPHSQHAGALSFDDKAQAMSQILTALGADNLLDPAWRKRAAYYLEYQQWLEPAKALRVEGDRRQQWILALAAVAVSATLIVFLMTQFSSLRNTQVGQQDKDASTAIKPSPESTPPPPKPTPAPTPKPEAKPTVKPPAEKPWMEKPMVPVEPRPEDPPEPTKREYEIAQLPAPPPGEYPFWGSPSDPAAPYKMGGELKLEWEVWSNPQKRRINVDKFELHGFSVAMEPWSRTTGKSDPRRLPLDVTLTKITPGVHAVRVTGQDGLPVELARFQIPLASGKLLLTMDLKTRTWPSYFEIQKQILFCVVELSEDDGTSFFVALQPLLPAKKIVMSRDEIQAGNIRSKTDLGGAVPCPMSTSLQRLSIARGVLTFKDMRRYIIGQVKWEDATSASEWPLKPVESAPPLENFRAVVAQSGRVFSLTMAASATKDTDLEASIARCEKEIKEIMDARGKVSRGKKARVDNDRAKYLAEGAAQLCKLLKIEPKKLPTPFSLKGDAKPAEIKAETARVQADWRDYYKWSDETVAAVDKRQKELQAELDGLKKKRGELMKEGSTAAEEVRSQLDYAIVELYREVPLNAGERNVRVPVMLFPE
ncbi:MAG: hypothetical protein U0935_16530 [Pirellulales bacterium]